MPEFTIQDNYTIFNAPPYGLLCDDPDRRASIPYSLRTEKEHSNLTDKQKRAYNRIKTGSAVALAKGEILRFITLTTASGVTKHLNKSFNHLKMRIERAKRYKRDGKTKKDGFDGFKFNKYFKIETKEGNGVLHIVYRGTKKHYLPKKWLTETWKELHEGSEITHIRIVGKENARLAHYLTANYLTKNPIKRMSYGWAWIFRGYVKTWGFLKEKYLNGYMRNTPGSIKNTILAVHFACMIRFSRSVQYYFNEDLTLSKKNPIPRPPRPPRPKISDIGYKDTIGYMADQLLREKGVPIVVSYV